MSQTMTPSTGNNERVPSALRFDVKRSVAAMRLVIVATTLYWLVSGQPLWVFVGAVSAALTFLPAACVKDPPLRTACSLCVSALLFAHIVLGMQAGLYETSAVYDKLMHMLGCGAIAGIVITAASQYCKRNRIQLPGPLLWVLAIGIVVSLGTFWEIFEFAIDRTGLFQAQRGLTDTMLDLIADLLGALVTATAVVGHSRRSMGMTP